MNRLGLALVAALAGSVAWAADPAVRPARPCVVLALDGTGDFGPQTTGTRTAGWQEALDYCKAHKRDLFVQGGWGGRDAIYHVQETIRVPASQDFRIDGGVYVLNWTGPAEKDLVVVDSGMDCHYRMGILVYGGKGAALRIQPHHPVPIDNVAVFIDSDVVASSIADPRPFERGKREGGAGVVFDTSHAPILHADFSFTAILNFATCVVMPDSGHPLAYTRFHCGHLHTNADQSTLLSAGRQTRQNDIDVRIGVDQGASGVTGLELAGSQNRLLLNTRGGFPDHGTLRLGPTARDNRLELVFAGGNPLDLLADQSKEPNNRLLATGDSPPIERLRATAGTFTYTQRLLPASVRIEGGAQTRSELRRGNQAVSCHGQESILLDVGDQLVISSVEAPTLLITPQMAR